MSLGLCVLVRDRQDSIAFDLLVPAFFVPGRVESFVPDCRTGRMLPGAQDLFFLLL